MGLGAHGSSTLFHLAKHYGPRVLGLEQYQVSHSLGSSHGLSRIIRLSYFEHPAYVAMLRRAFKLWRELEEESGGEKLLTQTGSLDIGIVYTYEFKNIAKFKLELCFLKAWKHLEFSQAQN